MGLYGIFIVLCICFLGDCVMNRYKMPALKEDCDEEKQNLQVVLHG